MRFSIPLTATKMTGRFWYVEKEFTYYIGKDEVDFVTVPEGFVSDLASVPCGLWNLFPPDDSYSQSAVLHDFCCLYATWSISKTDYIFYESMGVLGVQKWKRWIMYMAVKMFHIFRKQGAIK